MLLAAVEPAKPSVGKRSVVVGVEAFRDSDAEADGGAAVAEDVGLEE